MGMKDAHGMPIRILIADDHAVFRGALRALLEKECGLKVVAEAGDGWEALEALVENDVDVLLLDISMPGLSGIQVAERLMRDRKDLAIVVLTMHEDETYLQKLMKIGVRAFVLKKSVGEDLFQAIRAAHEGEWYIDPSLGGTVISSMFGPPKENNISELDKLTPREREVCRLLALGHTNAEIGEQLSISESKVEMNRSSIMAKLGLSNRAGLVRFAIGAGLLKPE